MSLPAFIAYSVSSRPTGLTRTAQNARSNAGAAMMASMSCRSKAWDDVAGDCASGACASSETARMTAAALLRELIQLLDDFVVFHRADRRGARVARAACVDRVPGFGEHHAFFLLAIVELRVDRQSGRVEAGLDGRVHEF